MKLEKDTNISHYKILSEIGKGGMGEVYLAEDTELDRKVAIKILSEEFSKDSEQLNRFVQEAKAASALNHPNIITVYEIGKTDNSRFIALEHIEGVTLANFLKNPLKLDSALDIATQIASALEAAHSAGIVHRDIKPDNVMVRVDGLVKILDFGIAKLTEQEIPEIESEDKTVVQVNTTPGMIIGTANYMSPEQAKGKDVDSRTDIFSFGVLLYGMISGHLPFEGETPMEIISSILKDEPKRLVKVHPELEQIIDKSLRKDRDDRYGDIKKLLDDLRSLKRRIEFEVELERTSSPDINVKTETQILKTVTDETTAAVQTASFGNSIAVLPFANISADAENEYFCDGLAEDLLNALTKIENLKVAARTSAFHFKGKNVNVSEIGKTLGVSSVLEGSVRRSGDRLRISVQLVNAADGYHVWSERFDREMEDIFDVQDEITLSVVDALKLNFFGNERSAMLKRGTKDTEAYQYYLKGRFQWNKRTGESLKAAAAFYDQAIEIDPNYARAYAGLAECYVLFDNYRVASATDSMPRGKAAALRALELDDSLAEAHNALGFVLSIYSWNQEASEIEYRMAIELNSKYPTAHHWLGGTCLVIMGRFDEAIKEGRRAEELDPLSLIISADTGVNLFYSRRFDEAIAQFKRTLAIDRNFYFARYYLASSYHAKAEYSEAISEYRKALEISDDPQVKALLARSLATSGNRDEAAEIINELTEDKGSRYIPNSGIALALAALGKKDEAFKLLEKDFIDRSFIIAFSRVDPAFDDLRDDPRFEDLQRRVESSVID